MIDILLLVICAVAFYLLGQHHVKNKNFTTEEITKMLVLSEWLGGLDDKDRRTEEIAEFIRNIAGRMG